jgi:peroxiredoxin
MQAQDQTWLQLPGDFPGQAVVVTFIRGHWCPYCRRYLKKLNDRLEEFVRRDARLAVVSPESMSTSSALVHDLGLKMPVLADANGKLMDRLGIRNRGAGLDCHMPHPSLYILNAAGEIRFRSVDRNYKKRTTLRAILGVLDDSAH